MKPVISFLGSFVSYKAVTQSQYCTLTIDIGSEFEAQVPIQIGTPANVSAGAEIYTYRIIPMVGISQVIETEGKFQYQFPATGGSTMSKVITLKTGFHLIQVMVGGGSAATWSVSELTARVITAYE